MIYTIGHTENYQAAIGKYGAITKLPGGYAFQTVEDALEEIKRVGKVGKWSVWSVKADWNQDVILHENGFYHVLIAERWIIGQVQ